MQTRTHLAARVVSAWERDMMARGYSAFGQPDRAALIHELCRTRLPDGRLLVLSLASIWKLSPINTGDL